MATVNFSVPDEVKDVFNKQFKGRNKSAVIARLMEQAVEEDQRQSRRKVIMDELLARVVLRREASEADFLEARDFLRDA